MVATLYIAAGLLTLLVSNTNGASHRSKRNHKGLHARWEETSAGPSWNLQHDWSNSSFFEAFDFFAHDDPTHGMVNYLDHDAATSDQDGKEPLAYINRRGNPVIRVDRHKDLAYGQNRDSVRITSKEKFKKGQLLLLDARHMPTGCASWPAFWTVGATRAWPAGGEIDIVEGVNNDVFNRYTLHTTEGCKTKSPMQAVSSIIESDCNVYSSPNNLGCGNLDPNARTFGGGFNRIGGGVYATLWDDSGISVFFFPRDQIPQDISTGSPNPTSWGAPRSRWENEGCNTSDFFDEQTIVINTTLCGDWAGSEHVYPMSGCPGTCATQVMGGSNFKRAYWEINYVRIFSSW